MKVIAIIPAKSRSTRVPNKNFRAFCNNKSLLEIKIEQCLNSKLIDEVYVSSNSEEAKLISEKYDVKFLFRDEALCLDSTPWNEVLLGTIKQTEVEDDVFIAWCPVTSPLFGRFDDVINCLNENSSYDSIMGVTKHKHFFLNSDYIPSNFQFGVWASYTQNIKPFYQMNCSFWIASKEKIFRNNFQTGDSPYFYETSNVEGIDIDEMHEFEEAQILYEFYNRNI